ncbi:hypothetical protein EJ110_NYTH31600 [Nymphaea thermarum]|nr:hypothetical protein EJ110_NYTH31600 [Nymphaea thermarum]
MHLLLYLVSVNWVVFSFTFFFVVSRNGFCSTTAAQLVFCSVCSNFSWASESEESDYKKGAESESLLWVLGAVNVLVHQHHHTFKRAWQEEEGMMLNMAGASLVPSPGQWSDQSLLAKRKVQQRET